jgi:hypothetical protein
LIIAKASSSSSLFTCSVLRLLTTVHWVLASDLSASCLILLFIFVLSI